MNDECGSTFVMTLEHGRFLEAFVRHKQIRLPAHQHDLHSTSEVVRQVEEEAESLWRGCQSFDGRPGYLSFKEAGMIRCMLRFFLRRAALRRDPQKQLAGRHRGEPQRVGRLSFVAAILE